MYALKIGIIMISASKYEIIGNYKVLSSFLLGLHFLQNCFVLTVL